MKFQSLLAGVAAAFICFTGSASAAGYFAAKSTAAVALGSAGVWTEVVAVNVNQQGTWIVQGKASLINFGAADFNRCNLYWGSGGEIDGATTMTGGYGPVAATVALLGVVNIPPGKYRISLNCEHDGHVDGQYVDPSASIVLSRVPLL